jgi:hypothetical protein
VENFSENCRLIAYSRLFLFYNQELQQNDNIGAFFCLDRPMLFVINNDIGGSHAPESTVINLCFIHIASQCSCVGGSI